MLEDTGGGGVDDGRLERGGEAAGRADLFCARSSHRDEPRALLVVLHVERVRRADCGNLGSVSKNSEEEKNHLQDLFWSVHRMDSGD